MQAVWLKTVIWLIGDIHFTVNERPHWNSLIVISGLQSLEWCKNRPQIHYQRTIWSPWVWKLYVLVQRRIKYFTNISKFFDMKVFNHSNNSMKPCWTVGIQCFTCLNECVLINFFHVKIISAPEHDHEHGVIEAVETVMKFLPSLTKIS